MLRYLESNVTVISIKKIGKRPSKYVDLRGLKYLEIIMSTFKSGRGMDKIENILTANNLKKLNKVRTKCQ